jgi:hypothetical protein
MARCARCDVRCLAAVFGESGEMTLLVINSVLVSCRRLRLQIGGANITGVDRALMRGPALIAALEMSSGASARNLGLRWFLTVCTGSNLCRAHAGYVNVGFGDRGLAGW